MKITRLIAPAAVVPLLALGACGSSSTTAGTSPTSSATSVASPGAPAPVAAGSALSAEQMKALLVSSASAFTSAHMAMTMASTVKADITADFARTDAGVVMAMKMSMPQLGNIEARLVDNAFYMQIPSMGGKWVKIPLDSSNALGKAMSSLTKFTPDQMVAQYAGGITGGTYVGEDADGKHYRIQVDTTKAASSVPSALSSAAGGLGGLPKTMVMDLWLQGGLPHKELINLGKLGTVTAVMSDFGKKVTVVAPPTADVTTMPGMS